MTLVERVANTAISRLTRKDWSGEAAEKYIGAFSAAYLTHAEDESLRENAASGGTVSALLIEWLTSDEIDGALVCRTVLLDGRVRAEYIVAQSRDEIMRSQGSKYVRTSFAHEALPLIKAFDGRIAVVGLPCDIEVVRRRMAKDAEIGDKVVCTLAIVCGHNSEPDLVDRVANRLEQEAGSRLTDYRFRRGHWRGKLQARFERGQMVEHSYSQRFGLYQNLYFWSEKKCFQCHDHWGYDADLSIGDVWSPHLKNDPIKHSGVLIKTERGREMFERAVANEALHVRAIAVEDLLDGQARTGPFHYNVSARIDAARLHRLKLKDRIHEKIRWNDRLAAHIALFNWRWSRSPRWRGLIFKVPRPILKTYLYFLKFLESI